MGEPPNHMLCGTVPHDPCGAVVSKPLHHPQMTSDSSA